MISSEHARCLFWALENVAGELDVSRETIAARLEQVDELDVDERAAALAYFDDARRRSRSLPWSLAYYPEAGGYRVSSSSFGRRRVELVIARLATCPRDVVLDLEAAW